MTHKPLPLAALLLALCTSASWAERTPPLHATLKPINGEAVSYTHLTLPTNREV